MKKYRLNKYKLFRNFIVLSNVITIGIVIHKIATCGISFISTIRILRIGGQSERNLERCS